MLHGGDPHYNIMIEALEDAEPSALFFLSTSCAELSGGENLN